MTAGKHTLKTAFVLERPVAGTVWGAKYFRPRHSTSTERFSFKAQRRSLPARRSKTELRLDRGSVKERSLERGVGIEQRWTVPTEGAV